MFVTVYVCLTPLWFLVSPNDVPVPKIKGKKKKSVIAVGEVSSAGRKVTVRRSGDVIVHDFSSEEDSEDEYEIENSDSDEELVTSVEKVQFLCLIALIIILNLFKSLNMGRFWLLFPNIQTIWKF